MLRDSLAPFGGPGSAEAVLGRLRREGLELLGPAGGADRLGLGLDIGDQLFGLCCRFSFRDCGRGCLFDG